MKKSLLIAALLSLPLSFGLHAGSDVELDETEEQLKKMKINSKKVLTRKLVKPHINTKSLNKREPYFVPATPTREPLSTAKLKKLLKTGRFEVRDGMLWQKTLEAPIPVKNPNL